MGTAPTEPRRRVLRPFEAYVPQDLGFVTANGAPPAPHTDISTLMIPFSGSMIAEWGINIGVVAIGNNVVTIRPAERGLSTFLADAITFPTDDPKNSVFLGKGPAEGGSGVAGITRGERVELQLTYDGGTTTTQATLSAHWYWRL